MKKILPDILFYYSALVAAVITISSGTFVFWFLPVITYFLMEASRRIFFAKDQVLPGKIDRFLTYYGFIVSTLMVITGLASAHSTTEFLTAGLFSPILIYFAIRIFPKRTRAINIPEVSRAIVLERSSVPDFDRRAFLKLIGTAGLSLFMFALFTKKAEAAFFGSVPGPGTVSLKDASGNKIDPAEKHPTDGYNITDLDDSSPAYYGFVNKTGAWFIMKEDATTGAYRYTKGTSGYSTNWTSRASLSYDYFDNVF